MAMIIVGERKIGDLTYFAMRDGGSSGPYLIRVHGAPAPKNLIVRIESEELALAHLDALEETE